MDEILIPKESEYVLIAMYKEFLDKYNNGVPRNKAKFYGDQNDILKLVPEIPEQDIYDLLLELSQCKMINVSPGSNTFVFVSLNTEGIIYMENKLGKDISKVVDWLIKAKQLLL